MAISVRRTLDQIKEHYDIEKELASRLRNATKGERRRLYNVVYDERSQRISHHPLVVRARDPKSQARAVIPQMRLLNSFIKSDSVFLEVGAGDCALAREVAIQVKQVYAVDVTKELMHNINQPDNFMFLLVDGIDIPMLDESINIVYSNQVMEHLRPEDAHDQLRSIHKTLVHNGFYICITPNPLSGPHDVSKYFDEVATGFHLKEYTITDLAEAFRSAGFSEVRAFVSYHGYVLSPVLPLAPFVWIEKLITKLPRSSRRKLAYLLTAVKLIAIK